MLQILRKRIFAEMYRFTQKGKIMTAALLLGLLVFILVEKSAHGHTAGNTAGSTNSHAILHPGITCLVCDFQLPASDAVPGEFSLIILPEFHNTIRGSLPGHYINPAPSPFTERGPPSIC